MQYHYIYFTYEGVTRKEFEREFPFQKKINKIRGRRNGHFVYFSDKQPWIFSAT